MGSFDNCTRAVCYLSPKMDLSVYVDTYLALSIWPDLVMSHCGYADKWLVTGNYRLALLAAYSFICWEVGL